MASDVHLDKQSHGAGSPRSQPWFVGGCCAEPYAPGRRTKLQSGSARRHSSASKQTSSAAVSVPIGGEPSCVHSDCPRPNRFCPRETPAVRWSEEIPRWPRRSCGGPLVPPPGRGEGQRPPTVAPCRCACSGRGVGPLVGPNCARLGESFAAAPFRPCRLRSRPGEGCSTSSRLGFFYLEIGVRTLAPGLTGPIAQPGSAQAPTDSGPSQVFQPGPLPEILLQLGQRPSGETQPQIPRMGGRHLQNPSGSIGIVIGRASRADAICQALDSGGQEPLYPTVSVGIVETHRLAGLRQRAAGRQLPDQGNSLLHSSRCGAGAQQALQIHQLFARQFGKSKDAAHADRVALTTPQVKSNIAIFMNKMTSEAEEYRRWNSEDQRYRSVSRLLRGQQLPHCLGI